jgi:hypothetical protein
MYDYNDLLVFPEKQATEEEIIGILKKYNIPLEKNIVDFLVKYNGCKFMYPKKQWLKIEENQYICLYDIVEFEGIENGILYQLDFSKNHFYLFSDCLLGIMSDDWKNIYIGFDYDYKGQIYRLDYELYEADQNYSKMLVKIGDSLEDVFSRLITYDELPDEWK